MSKKRTFKANGSTYDIPEVEVKAFLADNPNAIEMNSYVVNKDTFDIPIEKTKDFLADNPNAKSTFGDDLKKKVDLPSTSQSPSSNVTKDVQPTESSSPSGINSDIYTKYFGVPKELLNPAVRAKAENIAKTKSPHVALAEISKLAKTQKVDNEDEVIGQNNIIKTKKVLDYNQNVTDNYNNSINQIYGDLGPGGIHLNVPKDVQDEVLKQAHDQALTQEAGQRITNVKEAHDKVSADVAANLEVFSKDLEKVAGASSPLIPYFNSKKTILAKDITDPTTNPFFLKEYSKVQKEYLDNEKVKTAPKPIYKSIGTGREAENLVETPESIAIRNEHFAKYDKIEADFESKMGQLAKVKSATTAIIQGVVNKKIPTTLDIGLNTYLAVGNRKVAQSEKLRQEGIDLTPEMKYDIDKLGVDAIKDVISIYTPLAQNGDETAIDIVNVANKMIADEGALLKRNPEFANKQAAEIISNELADNPHLYLNKELSQIAGGTSGDIVGAKLRKITGLYDVDNEMIAKIAQNKGIPQEIYSRLTDNDIKTANVFGAAASGLFGESITNMAGWMERIRNRGKGYTPEAADELANRWKEKESFFRQLYKVPQTDEMIEGPTVVNSDPASQTYLENERNPAQGNWNFKAENVLNEISFGAAQMYGLGKGGIMTGGLMGKVGLIGTEARLLSKAGKLENAILSANTTAERISLAEKSSKLLTKAGNATELADKVGMFTYGAITGYDRNYEQGLAKFEGQENAGAKAAVFAALYSGAENWAEQIFPETRLVRNIEKPTSQAALNLISRIATNGAKGLEKKEIASVIKEIAKGAVNTATGVADEVKEEVATNIAGQFIERITGANKDPNYNFVDEQVKTIAMTAISATLPIAVGQFRISSPTKNNLLHHVANNAPSMITAIQTQEKAGKIDPISAGKQIVAINTLADLNRRVPKTDPKTGKKLSTDEHAQFLSDSYKIALAEEEKKRATPIVAERLDEVIADATERQQTILDSPTTVDVHELEVKQQAKKKKVDDALSSLIAPTPTAESETNPKEVTLSFPVRNDDFAKEYFTPEEKSAYDKLEPGSTEAKQMIFSKKRSLENEATKNNEQATVETTPTEKVAENIRPTTEEKNGYSYNSKINEVLETPSIEVTDKDGKKVGQLNTYTSESEPDVLITTGIEVNPKFQKQGIAKELYTQLAKQNPDKTIRSSGQITPDSKGVWESLVRDGIAEKVSENKYEIKPQQKGSLVTNSKSVQTKNINGVTSNTYVSLGEKDGVSKATFTGDRSDKVGRVITGASYTYDNVNEFESDYGVNLEEELPDGLNINDITQIRLKEERAISADNGKDIQSITAVIVDNDGNASEFNIPVNKRKFTSTQQPISPSGEKGKGEQQPTSSKTESNPALSDLEDKVKIKYGGEDKDLKGNPKRQWMLPVQTSEESTNRLASFVEASDYKGREQSAYIDKNGENTEVKLRNDDGKWNWYYPKSKKPFASFGTAKDAIKFIQEQPFWDNGEINNNGRNDAYFAKVKSEQIKTYLENGNILEDINDGKILVSEAKSIIENAGLKVPKEIESLLSKEQPTDTKKVSEEKVNKSLESLAETPKEVVENKPGKLTELNLSVGDKIEDTTNGIKYEVLKIVNGKYQLKGLDGKSNIIGKTESVYKKVIENKEAKNESITTEIEQRSTEVITTSVETIISKAEVAETEEEISKSIDDIESALNEINSKIGKLTESYSTEGIAHEYPNVAIGKAAKKEITKYAKEIAKMLNWEIPSKNGVYDNIPPAGGEVIMKFNIPNTSLQVYVQVKYEPEYGDNGYENYKFKNFFYRVENTAGKGQAQYVGKNNTNYGNMTAKEFAVILFNEAKPFINSGQYSTEQKAVEQPTIAEIVAENPNRIVMATMPKQEVKKVEPDFSVKPSKIIKSKEVQAEINKQLEEFRKASSNLTSGGLDPKKIETGTKLIGLYIKQGVYKFSEIAENVYEQLGESLNDFMQELKAVYAAYYQNTTDDIAEKMDESVRNITFETIKNKYNAESNTSLSNNDSENSPKLDDGESSTNANKDIQAGQTKKSPKRPIGESRNGNGSTNEGGQEGGGSRGNSNSDNSSTDGGQGTSNANKQKGPRTNRKLPTDINATNFQITDSNFEIPKGEIARIKSNIEAIKLVKELVSENRNATPEEKNVLAKYVGWGGLSTVLDEGKFNYKWGNEDWHKKYASYHEQLKSILTDEEFTNAVNSTTTSFYTDKEVVKNVWDLVGKLGFNGGDVLESAIGTGMFYGLMPRDLQDNSNLIGYELDTVTGLIASKLYPEANIRITGYQNSVEKNNSVDLAITNVPFGKNAPFDKNNEDITSFSLHNYFIAKNIKKLKPGGIGIFITSASTMDNVGASTKFRSWTNNEGNADFIGAIRLPNNAFDSNAGTQVTTDILIYKKRTSDVPSSLNEQYRNVVELKQVEVDGKQVPIEVNEYYVNNPEMMLGEMTMSSLAGAGGLYGRDSQTLEQRKGEDIKEALATAIDKLPKNIFGAEKGEPTEKIFSTSQDKEGTIVDKDGKIYYVDNGELVDTKWSEEKITGENKKKHLKSDVAKDYISVKTNAKNLVQAEQSFNTEDTDIDSLRDALNKSYDNFVKKYGVINNNRRINFLQDDSEYNSFAALEDVKKSFEVQPDGKLKRLYHVVKSPIFNKRVNFPTSEPVRAENVGDALNISISYRNNIDLNYIASLTNKTEDEAKNELIESGLAFENPENGLLEDTDSYLSGFVRTKYKEALSASETDSKFKKNADELEKVVPKDIPPSLIEFKLGSSWIPAEYVKQFIKDVIELDASVQYNKSVGRWSTRALSYSTKNNIEFASGNMTALDLIDKALNLTQPVVQITTRDASGNKTSTKDVIATAAAQTKMAEISELFYNYIKSNSEIMKDLSTIYNDVYNDFVEKKYSLPTFVHFPNANKEITLRLHQRKAVARALKDSVLLAHQVGTGKAQPLDAKILTPSGWELMGNIKIGDLVYSSDGLPTKVLGVFPQGEKEIFKVTFSDGSLTECCEEHLWLTHTYQERNNLSLMKGTGKDWECAKPKVRTLKEIKGTILGRKIGNRYVKNHSIPITSPVVFKGVKTYIDPYIIGALIGDGGLTGKGVILTNIDEELIEKVSRLLPNGFILSKLKDTNNQSYGIRKIDKSIKESAFITELRKLGLFGKKSNEKRIPSEYLFNSIQSRLELLKGLMDTDGTVDKKTGGAFFYSTSKGLIDDVQFLVQSLGGVCSVTSKVGKYKKEGVVKNCLVSYALNINIPNEFDIFSLTRKLDIVKKKTKYFPVRYIVSVESVGYKAAQCISVENESHLYLTDNCIVTHNTYTMITTAMEMRRLGIAKKPMIVVQNATLEQFGKDFKKLYPNANILVPSAKEMDATNRQKLFNKIAYGDFDSVIIPQSFLDFIPDDENRERAYLQEQIDELQEALSEAEDRGAQSNINRSIKSLQDALDNVGVKKKTSKVKDIAKKNQSAEKKFLAQANRRKDDVLNFENMGIDALFLDEAHNYKKLGFSTKMNNVKGVDTGRSKRALGAYMKVRWIQEKNKGRNVVLATGTPITNTMAEAHTMMRFVSPDILDKYNMTTFDEFASTFGDVQPSLEFGVTGSFKVVERFKSFINVPELLTAFRSKTDVVLTEDIPEFKESNSIPKLKVQSNVNGKEKPGFTNVILKQTDELKAIMGEFKRTLEAWQKKSGKEKRETSYIPLLIFNRAKQAAIDLRLIDPTAEDVAGSKTNAVVNNVFRIFNESSSYKGSQFIFADNYQSPEVSNRYLDDEGTIPNPAYGKGRFNLYEDIKAKLVAMGVPSEQIAIINDFEKEKKDFLFEKVRNGDVRIVLGSTEKMGVGVNAQERMVALHHVDAPARPMDFEQRNGRILRQGNIHAEMNIPVEVLTYGVEKTLDATAYQRLEIKQKFINQMMKGDISQRTMGDEADEDDVSNMGFGEMMATLSGSQYALIAQVKKLELQKLQSAKANHERTIIDYNDRIRYNKNLIKGLEARYETGLKTIEVVKETFPENKIQELKVGNETFTEELSKNFSVVTEALEKRIKNSSIKQTTPEKFSINGLEGNVTINYYIDTNSGGIPATSFSYFIQGKDELIEIYGNNYKSAASVFNSINAKIRAIVENGTVNDNKIADIPERVERYKKDNAEMSKKLDEPFGKQDKLEAVEKELLELEAKMEQEIIDDENNNPDDDGNGGDIPDNEADIKLKALSEPNAKFDTITRAAFDKLIGQLKKAFPDTNVFTDQDLFKEKLKQYGSDYAQYISTPNGIIYGAKLPDGSIYINTDELNSNAPIHEFSHLWEEYFPSDWKIGIDIIRNSKEGQAIYDSLKTNTAYSGKSDNDIWSEALNTVIGNKGEKFVNNKNVFSRLTEWIKRLFNKLGKRLGLDLSPETHLDLFAQKVIGDLLGGKPLINRAIKNNNNKFALSKESKNEISQRLSKENEQGRAESSPINAGATNVASRIHRTVQKEQGISNANAYGKIKQLEEVALIEYAKENKLLLELPNTEIIGGGNESDVYLHSNPNLITKVTFPNNYNSWLEMFDSIAIHNTENPNTKYVIKGFTTNRDGDFSIIVEQNKIQGTHAPFSKIHEDLINKGFELSGDYGDGRYVHKEKNIVLEDVKEDNVIIDNNGNLFYIDTDYYPYDKMRGGNYVVNDNPIQLQYEDIKSKFPLLEDGRIDLIKKIVEVGRTRDELSNLVDSLVANDDIEQDEADQILGAFDFLSSKNEPPTPEEPLPDDEWDSEPGPSGGNDNTGSGIPETNIFSTKKTSNDSIKTLESLGYDNNILQLPEMKEAFELSILKDYADSEYNNTMDVVGNYVYDIAKSLYAKYFDISDYSREKMAVMIKLQTELEKERKSISNEILLSERDNENINDLIDANRKTIALLRNVASWVDERGRQASIDLNTMKLQTIMMGKMPIEEVVDASNIITGKPTQKAKNDLEKIVAEKIEDSVVENENVEKNVPTFTEQPEVKESKRKLSQETIKNAKDKVGDMEDAIAKKDEKANKLKEKLEKKKCK